VNSKGHPGIHAPTEVGILDEVGAGDRATLRVSQDAVLGREERGMCKVLDVVDKKPLLIVRTKLQDILGLIQVGHGRRDNDRKHQMLGTSHDWLVQATAPFQTCFDGKKRSS
jgi:hypothetical protein